MRRRGSLGSLPVVVAALAVAACSAPQEIKTAAQLQLEALREAQQATDQYVVAVDRLLAEGSAITKEAQLMQRANTAVDEVMKGIGNEDDVDLLKASDDVAVRIAQAKARTADSVRQLDGFRKRHKENLGHLSRYLKLLERSQQLLVEYLLTDVGPTSDQVTELGAQIQGLGGQLAGGGS